ncbi:MAG: dTDP-4-dehydrorhamnose reductase [Desulfuromonadaceae bacterium]
MKNIALIGANGMLASAVKRLLPDGYRIVEYDLPEFDLTSKSQVLSLRGQNFQIILNCAAYTNVDGCETNRDLAMQVNGEGPGLLAELALMVGAILIHVSTDFIFPGNKDEPYRETDPTGPLSAYGQSKLLGEQRIAESGLKTYFIVRTSWLYGADGNNFVETIIRLAKERDELKVVDDQRGTPTWTDDLAHAIFALLKTKSYGIYHFSNEGECSWCEFAVEIIDQMCKLEPLKVETVAPIPTEAYPLPAVRPKYSVLSKNKIRQAVQMDIPAWQQSLSAYLRQRITI